MLLAADESGHRLRVRFEAGPLPLPAGLAAGGATHHVVEQLMDQVTVADGRLVMDKRLPTAPADPTVADTRRRLSALPVAHPLAMLQRHNTDLAETLLVVQEREARLARLNAELEQTNQGVVALCAELEERADQVRRAQRVVFEQLEDALRPPPPTVAGVELAVRYLPAQENSPTGGDLYDWLVLPDGCLHVAVVDAVGHGVASTRDALHVTHAIRTLTLEGHPLGRVLAEADRLLQAPGREVLATALVARLDLAAGVLSLGSGGHPPALLTTRAGVARYLDVDGRPLGYPLPGSDTVSDVPLHRGDTVLLYSDGLVEQDRDIIDGMATLAAAAAAHATAAVDDLLDGVLQDVGHGRGWRDDTMLLAIRWAGE